MKVTFEFDREERVTRVLAQAGEYDAVPLAPKIISAVPTFVSADRQAVAAALLFHNLISGELFFDETRTCSRFVAAAISEFFSPLDVLVLPQSLTPVKAPEGNLAYQLRANAKPEMKLGEDPDRVIRFVNGAVGSCISEYEAIIGTNIHVPSVTGEADGDAVVELLGALVLFADDHRILEVELEEGYRASIAPAYLAKVQAILSSVNIILR